MTLDGVMRNHIVTAISLAVGLCKDVIDFFLLHNAPKV